MFAETDNSAKLFMAKWDIKDGFWCMGCTEGEEWNFPCVLPQLEEAPTQLVIPNVTPDGLGGVTPVFLHSD